MGIGQFMQVGNLYLPTAGEALLGNKNRGKGIWGC